MADVGSHHFVKSGDKSHRVLVPQPSDHQHDPLNWSLGWKIATIVSASFVTFMQGFGPLSLAPMFGDYIEAFHCTLADAVQFTGVAILVLGFSNFIWSVQSFSGDAICGLTPFQGPDQHVVRPAAGLHLVSTHLSRFFYLASQSSNLW